MKTTVLDFLWLLMGFFVLVGFVSALSGCAATACVHNSVTVKYDVDDAPCNPRVSQHLSVSVTREF